MQLENLICKKKFKFVIGRNFPLKTLISSFDHFVCDLNMFINCPNVQLQVGFVQSVQNIVCCDLTHVSHIQSTLTELNLVNDVKNSTIFILFNFLSGFPK